MNRNMGVPAGFNVGFDPSAAAGGAVAEPAGTGASSGGSPSPQPGAGAPASASPSGASAGASEPKTYRDEDVQRIVRERLADEQKKWKDLGDPSEVRARLERADRAEKAYRGEEPKGPTAEEKELRDILSKNGFVQKDEVDGMRAELQSISRARYEAHTKEGRGLIAKLASEKFGTQEAADLESFEILVSASISKDKESLAAWNNGDTSVISKHFDKVFDAPMFKSASARYSSGKAKDKAEVPPAMPKGGVQAPASEERKMSSDERKEAAYKFLKDRESQA